MSKVHTLSVQYRACNELKPYARNPRSHSKKQISQIADSITTFGFTNPILIDDEDGVLCGHGRLAAAKLLGHDVVPTIRLSNMSEAQKRAYILADNRLAELAGWDEDLLKIELGFLIEADADFSIDVTGFDMPDVNRILFPSLDDDAPEKVELPAANAQPVSQVGDLWQIGPHRLICGDLRDPDVASRLMAGERAAMIFTDPPYNVPIHGHVSGLGQMQHREFQMASGEMSREEFTTFLNQAMTALARVSKDGAIHFVCMDWRHLNEVLAAGEAVYSQLKNLIVWVKTNAGMRTS